MILKLLSLVNFKNHKDLKVNFSNSINCFLGDNGVGKTNLLDSIYYLSFCKSYYNTLENDNIFRGEQFFMLQGDFKDADGVSFVVNSSLINNQKHIKFNNKKYTKLSSHIGRVPSVIITPLDSSMILGGGDERRKFIDKILSQIDNIYMQKLILYNKTLQQRNSFLKDIRSSNMDLELISTYDDILSDCGSYIYSKRKECVMSMLENIQFYYDHISQKKESVDILYKSQLSTDSFKNILIHNRNKDRVLLFTSAGIHRDDFIFNIDSYSLKKSGSQGQQKTFLIALKFAYFDLLKNLLNIKPLLLLDDIFDKLDHGRVEQIVRILNKNQFGQIFITDTSLERITNIMKKVNSSCKYFIFDKTGLINERVKS